MDNNLSFEDFYVLMKVEGLIIIEDAIQYDSNRTAIMYDYLKMSTLERDLFLESISKHKTIVDVFTQISEKYEANKAIINWREVPSRDIEFYLDKKDIKDVVFEVERLSNDNLKLIEKNTNRFGMGIKSEAVNEYAQILKGAQQTKVKLPLRIYKDFSAEDSLNIRADIEEFTKNNRYFICIIDDFLGENPRGDEIINWLNENPKVKNQAVCILLSSRERQQLEPSKDNMYIEYVEKGNKQLEYKIKNALIKSQYFIMLKILKRKRMDALNETYNYALGNLNVAVHLSAMASEEGMTNYEVITNWLDLREKYNWQINNQSELQSVILLSSMLNMLSGEKFTTDYMFDDIKEIQIFEEYDYSVNKLNIPPMTGDIFLIKGEYYLLIGQECDLSIRNGKRNTPISELLPIKKLSNHDMGSFKEKYGYEKIVLGNFRDVDKSVSNIVIDCTKRVVMDNEILDLCIFNSEGKAIINLEQDLTIEQKCYLPFEWEEYYNNIKNRISKLLKIKENIEKNLGDIGFNMDDIIESMGASHGGRLVSIIDFIIDNNFLRYDTQRVCRIKNHVLLANKLYLEYRGRQAFNTINMDVAKTAQYSLKLDGVDAEEEDKTAVVVLTNKRSDNIENKYKNRSWIVKKHDILNFIKNSVSMDYDKWLELLKHEDEDILLTNRTGVFENGSIGYTKLSKDNKLTLKLQFKN